MKKVNLDALIPREDFEVKESNISSKKKDTISIEDLKQDSFFFSSVRKPDFQRETNEWDSKKIAEFVESFVTGDLIPAIILWRSSTGLLFVIDGSHRLSSLAAWINDDYGDGKISKNFYDSRIPEDQITIAQETKRIIDKNIGTFGDYELAKTNPHKVQPEIAARVRDLGSLAIQLQWVEGGADKAETSFFKINRQAAPINDTELILLESRKKPNCVAARAIIRSGTGHKYWSDFSEAKQEEIQNLAEVINNILFDPDLKSPIKTLDLPIAGKNYSAQTLSLILDFVNLSNEIVAFKEKVEGKAKGSWSKNGVKLENDTIGDETINLLKKSRKIAWRINSTHSSSLGLHPIIYFYSKSGKYRIASFLAVVSWILKMEKNNSFNKFIRVRKNFEEAIFKYQHLIQQIIRHYRTSDRYREPIVNFFDDLIDLLSKGNSVENSMKEIIKKPEFKFLKIDNSEFEDDNEVTSSKFSSAQKSAVYIKDVVEKAPRCRICGGFIHVNSITIDHIERKEDGGLGSADNGQITHPYCNSTYKN